MSWKGFKKALVRIPHQIRASDVPDLDPDVANMLNEFDIYEAATIALKEDIVAYKKSLLSFFTNIDAFAQSFLDLEMPVERAQMLSDPDVAESIATVRTALSPVFDAVKIDANVLDSRIVAPLTELLGKMKNVRKIITKREHKMVDVNRYTQDKVNLKPDAEASLQMAMAEYTPINTKLKTELPVFLNTRCAIISPAFACLYAFQQNSFKKLELALAPLHTDAIAIRNFAADPIRTFELRRPELEAMALPLLLVSDPLKFAGRTSTANSVASLDTTVVPPPSYVVDKYVVALFDFPGQESTDLPFKKGDKIKVVKADENRDAWWTGEFNGRRGSFPGNYTSDV